jgi:hypothetical protein
MDFFYDESTHTYWADGVRIPSVSEVLEVNVIGDALWEWKRRGGQADAGPSQRTGTTIHSLMEKARRGEYTPDNTIQGLMVDYGLKAVKDVKRIGGETPLFHPKFGGTPDEYGEHLITHKHQVWDWKTNDKTKAKFKQYSLPKYEVQIAGGYVILLEHSGFHVDEAFIAHLPGRTIYPLNIERGIERFNRLLDGWYREINGVKVRDIVTMYNDGMTPEEISEILGLELLSIVRILDILKIY